jgi:phosphoenolpyruvate carboxykinase (GTP)
MKNGAVSFPSTCSSPASSGPGGRITWCTGAAPSGCGKTTTAMAGNHFVGDDLAQMWIADDGSDPFHQPGMRHFRHRGGRQLGRRSHADGLPAARHRGHLVQRADRRKRRPHWTGNGEPPGKGRNFQGDWKKGMTDANGKPVPISHPNARCTVASTALANYSPGRGSGRGGNPGHHLQRPGQRHHAAGVGGQNADQGWSSGPASSRPPPPPRWAPPASSGPLGQCPFIPGSLGDYMAAQFAFFGSLPSPTANDPSWPG